MSLEIDHVVFCVKSLDAASESLESDHGLASVPGGRHPGHGTVNRIVPLGEVYLELVAVVDDAEAERSSFGSWVGAHASSDLLPDAVCLRTDDLDPLCRRLGLEPTAMSREKPDGTVLRWRIAGLEATFTKGLPFFVEWDVVPEDHPGRTPLPQGSGTSMEVSLGGDIAEVSAWTRGSGDELIVAGGDAGVSSVVIRLRDRVLSL